MAGDGPNCHLNPGGEFPKDHTNFLVSPLLSNFFSSGTVIKWVHQTRTVIIEKMACSVVNSHPGVIPKNQFANFDILLSFSEKNHFFFRFIAATTCGLWVLFPGSWAVGLGPLDVDRTERIQPPYMTNRCRKPFFCTWADCSLTNMNRTGSFMEN